jgi:hypothetical protein
MRLTFSAEDGRVVTLDIDEAESLQNLSALLEAEMGIPMAQQALLHNGVILNAVPGNLQKSVAELGVHAEDMIGVHLNAATGGRARRRPGVNAVIFHVCRCVSSASMCACRYRPSTASQTTK